MHQLNNENQRAGGDPNNSIAFYGTRSGGRTLDQGEGGGNPFASALIELLARKKLTIDTLARDIVKLTERNSRAFQRAEVSPISSVGRLDIRSRPSAESRVALVSVFADYSASEGLISLPGAEHDARRVGAAFDAAGFDTKTLIAKRLVEVIEALGDYVSRSVSADFAVLYTTGHGVEINGKIYLLPGDYPISNGNACLSTHALRVNDLSKYMRAKRANLLFYAGCRDNPFR
jgi:hypothetical protein